MNAAATIFRTIGQASEALAPSAPVEKTPLAAAPRPPSLRKAQVRCDLSQEWERRAFPTSFVVVGALVSVIGASAMFLSSSRRSV